jgi:hypothetical protein
MDWIDLAQNADKWRTYEHGNETSLSTKFGNSFSSKGTVSLLRRALFHRENQNKLMPCDKFEPQSVNM